MDISLDPIAYPPSTGARRVHDTPLVVATPESLKGFGLLVDDPETFPIEIVQWPAQGEFCWQGETLYARNNAVGDSYLFGWSTWPEEAARTSTARRERALIWRANYHPDGGQLFHPLNGQSFVVPLALPGDDATPESFVTFWCDGRQALYLHPNVWHGAVVPHADEATFLDRQGRVHARVSIDFVREFGCYLGASLRRPD
jgi:ureidoglycolate lyase